VVPEPIHGPKGSRKGEDSGEDAEEGLSRLKLVLVCLSLFAYTIASAGWALFYLRLSLCFSYFVLSNLNDGGRIVLKAILITVGNYILFVVWLKVSLPKGIFGGSTHATGGVTSLLLRKDG